MNTEISEDMLALENTSAAVPHPRPKYKLEDLIAEMPDGLPIIVIEEWENMPSVGLENQ